MNRRRLQKGLVQQQSDVFGPRFPPRLCGISGNSLPVASAALYLFRSSGVFWASLKVIGDPESGSELVYIALADLAQRDLCHQVCAAGWYPLESMTKRRAPLKEMLTAYWRLHRKYDKLCCPDDSWIDVPMSERNVARIGLIGSCFSPAERCPQASPLSRKFTGSDVSRPMVAVFDRPMTAVPCKQVFRCAPVLWN